MGKNGYIGYRPFSSVNHAGLLVTTMRLQSGYRAVTPPQGELLGYTGNEPAHNAFLLGYTGKEPAHNAFLVGYADEEMIYLLPETAYRAVSEAIRAQGDSAKIVRNGAIVNRQREIGLQLKQ